MGEKVDADLKHCPICKGEIELIGEYSRAESKYLYSIFCNSYGWTFIPQSTWKKEKNNR